MEKGKNGWLPLVGEALYPSKLERRAKQKDVKIPSCSAGRVGGSEMREFPSTYIYFLNDI